MKHNNDTYQTLRYEFRGVKILHFFMYRCPQIPCGTFLYSMEHPAGDFYLDK